MKASELKLYNFVFYKGKVMQIQTNYELFKACIDCDRGINIEPIPLTEEWLLKFGWKRLDKYTFVKGKWFIYKRKKWFFTGSKKRGRELNHVHTLQNWWNGNTGQELKIK